MTTAPLPKASKGERPFMLDDPDTERLLTMVVALMGEVSVLHDQVDTLTRLLVERDVASFDDVRHYQPDDAATAERAARRKGLVERVMRIVIADNERAQRVETPYADVLKMVRSA